MSLSPVVPLVLVNPLEVSNVRKRKLKPRSLDDLKPAPYNPREIEPEALAGLKVSLSEFGDISGLVWNSRTGHVVAGHQRLEALRVKHGDSLRIEGGALVTPAGERFLIRVVDWPISKEKAANLAANSLLLQGTFTDDLGDVLGDLKLDLPDLTVDLRLDELVPEAEDSDQIKTMDLARKPIERVWVLIGIPAGKYPDHAEALETIARAEDTFFDSTIR